MNKINFLNKFSSKENLNHCQLAQANPNPAPQQAQTQARARLGQFVEQAAVATCVRVWCFVNSCSRDWIVSSCSRDWILILELASATFLECVLRFRRTLN